MAMYSHNPSFLIPDPLPDEIVYSRLVRFSILNGLSKSQTFKLIFGKKKVVINVQLPSYIKKLSDFGFGSCRDLILNQSLFLYFSKLIPYQRKKLYRSMCKNRGSAATKTSLLANIKCNQNYVLKYCSHCYQEDIKEHGVAYWHLSHQVPYQILCPRHFIELESTSPRIFELPKSKAKGEKILKCGLNLKPIGQLMLHTARLINNRKFTNAIKIDTLRGLQDLGYKTKQGRYRRKAIMHELLTYYRKSIKYLPFSLHDLTNLDFFDSILHPSRRQRSFSPIKLLLLSNWIENAKHRSNILKSKKRIRRKSVKKLMDIEISNIDSKIIIKGITGDHRKNIAKYFEVPVYRVENALSLFRGIIEIRKAIWRYQRRIKYRFKVLNYLYTTPNPSIKALKYSLNKEYYWLYLYDKNWLIKHQPNKDTSTLFTTSS